MISVFGVINIGIGRCRSETDRLEHECCRRSLQPKITSARSNNITDQARSTYTYVIGVRESCAQKVYQFANVNPRIGELLGSSIL